MTLNAPEVRAHMPLAEASLLCWRHVADPDYLTQLFEQHADRHYTWALSFPQMVQLVSDALLQHGGSGRRAFEAARADERTDATVQAFYGKLRRMPIAVSMAFLAGCSDRLRELYPAKAQVPLPASLADFDVLALDGKTVKNVQKRMKAARGLRGGVLGGKALVALSLRTDLVLAMHAHPDGEANEVRFVQDLLPALRPRTCGPRLYVDDRAFCNLVQAALFIEHGDHFLIRYNSKTSFHADPARPARTARDAQSREIIEQWGWLGRPSDPRRLYVRCLTLLRPDEEPLIVVTDLLDAECYPAADLLETYRMRWGIERVFQQVTEVFGLARLIGSSAEATVFQLAFCLLLYNIIVTMRAYIAAGQSRPTQTISSEKLFEDVKKHLVSWPLFFSHETTVTYLKSFARAAQVRTRLHRLLDGLWSPLWIKSPPQRRNPSPPRTTAYTHISVFRLQQTRQRRRGRAGR